MSNRVCRFAALALLIAGMQTTAATGLGGHAQGGEYTIRTAVGRDDGAIIPGAVTITEKVVAGFFS